MLNQACMLADCSPHVHTKNMNIELAPPSLPASTIEWRWSFAYAGKKITIEQIKEH